MELESEGKLLLVSILVLKRRIRRRLVTKSKKTFYLVEGDIQEQRAVWRLPIS